MVLQMATAKLLRDYAKPDWKWSHFPAGEHRNVRVAAKLKQMGTKAGWPDVVLLDPHGKFHGLELKRIGEDLNEAQEDFQCWCIRFGIPYSVARTTTDVLRILDAWGVLRIKVPT